MSSRARHGGFTLIEIILVVLIFAIMSALAYGGLNSVLKTRTAVAQSIDRTSELQRAYLRLRGDFQNLVLRPIRDNFGDDQPALLGLRDNMVEFTRGGWRNPLYLKRSSYERVGYRLIEHKLERASYRVLDRAQDTQPVRLTLLERVDEFELRYLNSQRDWVPQWPVDRSDGGARADAPPPLAVELTITTADVGKLRFLFKPGSEPAPRNLTVPQLANPSNPNTPNNPGSSDIDNEPPATPVPPPSHDPQE